MFAVSAPNSVKEKICLTAFKQKRKQIRFLFLTIQNLSILILAEQAQPILQVIQNEVYRLWVLAR